ncbi:putative Type 1 galactoside alpha-(1,2)-fucosyltransferase [Lupinus albus]|uniref:Fucosyltransferase n=1 Tax=Lupinus albus TaxID=3870 RepID=A0A6A4N1J5_LUPAL|nr:putative Type 1 galactoside alpha-(1,2)-fucosyltransferase [Lupinus albus]
MWYINVPLVSSTNEESVISISNEKDKFHDGLLVSEFDEASCISRFQSHLYRKVSHHKPSRYLISKVRNYEELHRRCGPNTIAYNKSMAYIENSKSNNGDGTMCKYIVWSPTNGLGNRIISMAATFLYAILTNRVLLVRFGKDISGLFCEPFLNSTWMLPNNSPFWKQDHIETYDSFLEKGRSKTNKTKEDLPSALFLYHQYTKEDPENFFHCDHTQDLLRDIPLLIMQTDQYFVPSLSMITSFNLEINKMFPEKDTIFYHLGHYLFHPSNAAWGLITRFYKTYLAKAVERIGLQIRVFDPQVTTQKEIMDLVLSCTIKNKILPKLDTQNSLSYSKNHTLKAVLVASLYPEYGQNLRAMYLNKPSVSGELIGVYQPSHEKQQKFHDNMHDMKAWTEMYLLSLSDVLITSSFSTFGYVAQGLGGLKPWLLVRPHMKKPNSPSCEQDLSSEPCFHFAPMHQCNGMPQKHFASSFPHLLQCKDFNRGLKLVSDSALL